MNTLSFSMLLRVTLGLTLLVLVAGKQNRGGAGGPFRFRAPPVNYGGILGITQDLERLYIEAFNNADGWSRPTVTEAKALLMSSGQDRLDLLQRPEYQLANRYNDSTKDGLLNQKEWIASVIFSMDQFGDAFRPPRVASVDAVIDNAAFEFIEVDLNHDWYLTPEEFNAGLAIPFTKFPIGEWFDHNNCPDDSETIFRHILERGSALHEPDTTSANVSPFGSEGTAVGAANSSNPAPALVCKAHNGEGIIAPDYTKVLNEQLRIFKTRECNACVNNHRFSYGARCDETAWYCRPKTNSTNKLWDTTLGPYPKRCKPPGWCGELAGLGFTEEFMSAADLAKYKAVTPVLPGLAVPPHLITEPPCGNLAEMVTADEVPLNVCNDQEECVPEVCAIEDLTIEAVKELLFAEADIRPKDGCVSAGEIAETLLRKDVPKCKIAQHRLSMALMFPTVIPTDVNAVPDNRVPLSEVVNGVDTDPGELLPLLTLWNADPDKPYDTPEKRAAVFRNANVDFQALLQKAQGLGHSLFCSCGTHDGNTCNCDKIPDATLGYVVDPNTKVCSCTQPTVDNGVASCSGNGASDPCGPASDAYEAQFEGFSCVDQYEFYEALASPPRDSPGPFTFFKYLSTGATADQKARDPQFMDKYLSRVDAYYWTKIDPFATRTLLANINANPRPARPPVIDDLVALMTANGDAIYLDSNAYLCLDQTAFDRLMQTP